MKIKLKDLNPNPFKKGINKGKLSSETIKKIKSNIKELGLMGSLPIIKKGKKFYLIAGHHRVEALKQTYGDNFKIECTRHNYNDEQTLRGMVVENLTQRADELIEVTENLNAIRTYLKKTCSADEQVYKGGGRGDKTQEAGSIRNIYKWLNKNGEVMSIGKIAQYLKINDNLDKRLLKNSKNSLNGKEQGKFGIEEAKILSKIEKKNQIVMKKLLDETGLDYKNKGKLVTEYQKAPEKIKTKILKEEIDITEIELETEKENLPNNALLNFQKSSEERCAELVEEFSLLKENMENWEKKTLNKCSIFQLNNMITFLQSFSKDRFLPFGKNIILRLAELGKENGLSPDVVANKFFPSPKITKKEV